MVVDNSGDRDLDLARCGDQGAFGRLMDSYTPRLVLFLRRAGGTALGADCDADDLFQMTMERAWRLLPEFTGNGQAGLHAWLVALGRAVIGNRVDYVRALKRDGGRHVESVVEGGGDRLPLDRAVSVSSLVARRDEIARLSQALAALGDLDRRIVEGSVLEGASLSDLAAETGLPRSSVFDRLGRALDEMRRFVPRATEP